MALTRADNPRLTPDPIVLLAQNAAGFSNLQKLSSRGFLETDPGNKPQIDRDVLAFHSEGLILLTGGTFGPIARLLAEGQREEAERLLAIFVEAFPDRTMMELHRHGLPIERAIEPGLITLADALGIPLVATNDCYFAKPSMHEAHDALLCIAEGRTLAERDRRRVTGEHWFKPAATMRALFADLPEACDNTLAIARMCAVMAESRKPLLPVCPKVRPGQTEDETLRAMAREGLVHRMDAIEADSETRARYVILKRAQATAEEKTSGQTGLFGGAEPEALRLAPLPDWEEMDRLAFEADAIGFHLTAHPLDAYAQVLRRLGAVPSNKLEERAQLGAARVKLAGSVINTKERITRSGSRMAWVRLSDGGGSFEVTFFSETLARSRELLAAGTMILVTADLKLEGDALRITAQEAEPLDAAAIRAGAGIRIWLQQTEAVAHIKNLLDREGKGRGRVVLVPHVGATQEVEIPLPGGFNVSARLAQALKIMPGVERVEEL
eukprot:gene2713-2752_t